ncbi:SHOCT domain-containing protein [Paeniglutamicibacter sp. R2-26]|uniref:SHOCT domain-containing protein n=1 Tax=Paeniglutamicibacter sp. R2-26 TaxID=3144417 RepID=UPI003EE7AB04
MMYGWNDGWGVWGWALMALTMLFFWGGVVTVVILLVRGRGSEGPGHSGRYGASHDEAERILNERFARGEIDETEFTARRETLRRKL